MNERKSFSLESVLGLPSIKEINKLSPYAVRLASRWANEWPGKIRELEAAGKLVTTLKQRAEVEALSEWRERVRMVRSLPEGKMDSAQERNSWPAP
jgi:hypothetical protein